MLSVTPFFRCSALGPRDIVTDHHGQTPENLGRCTRPGRFEIQISVAASKSPVLLVGEYICSSLSSDPLPPTSLPCPSAEPFFGQRDGPGSDRPLSVKMTNDPGPLNPVHETRGQRVMLRTWSTRLPGDPLAWPFQVKQPSFGSFNPLAQV